MSSEPAGHIESPRFRRADAANGLDRLALDVPSLYARYPFERRAEWSRRPARRAWPVYRSPLLPLAARLRVWQLAHRLQLDLAWFDSFQRYWTGILGGRPLLSPEDFHFLRGVYRLQSQDNQVPDTSDPSVHVAAWQQGELTYQLFFQTYLEMLYPRLEPARWLAKARVRAFCEFGCATAPVTTAVRQLFGDAMHATVADVPSVSLHYAAFKFRHDPQVEPMALRIEDRLLPPAGLRVDAIVCMTVFEHLLDPMLVAERFCDILPPGGWLLYDYHRSDAQGLDTRQGLEQRDAVLTFLRERFAIVQGSGGGDDLSIARKK